MEKYITKKQHEDLKSIHNRILYISGRIKELCECETFDILKGFELGNIYSKLMAIGQELSDLDIDIEFINVSKTETIKNNDITE